MTKIRVFLAGLPAEYTQKVRDELKQMGRDDVEVETVDVMQEPDPDCECALCSMRREAEAQGRNPLIHPSLKVKDGFVRDKVRHRLFTDTLGNVIFFNKLFHPVHEFNVYTLEIEGLVLEDFPLVRDQEPTYKEYDHTPDDAPMAECLRGTLRAHDGREVEITMLSGPTYDNFYHERLQRAH